MLLILVACGKAQATSGSTAQYGAKLYAANCADCHGKAGNRMPAVPLDSADFLASRGDATLLAVVAQGKGTMQGFAKEKGGPFADDQIRAVVAYLDSQTGRSSSSELATAGQRVFHAECARCHGDRGDRIPIVPLNAKGFLDMRTNEDLRRVITEGKGLMPAWGKSRGGPLDDKDIQAVISYLRYGVESQVAHNVSTGQDLYTSQCLVCHGAAGDRVPGLNLTSPQDLTRLGDGAIIASMSGGKGVMPAFGVVKGGPMTIGDIAAVLAYLKASAGLSATAALTSSATQGTGAALYAQNCAKCHGGDGMGVPGIPLFAKDFQDQRGDELIRETITIGGAAGMPAWGQKAGGPLGDDQIDSIIDFLKTSSLSMVAAAPSAGATPSPTASAAAQAASPVTPAPPRAAPAGQISITADMVSQGKTVFAQNCQICHAEGRDKVPMAKLTDSAWMKSKGLEGLKKSVTEGKPPIMPAWGKSKGGPLSDDEIANVVAYLWDAVGLNK